MHMRKKEENMSKNQNKPGKEHLVKQEQEGIEAPKKMTRSGKT